MSAPDRRYPLAPLLELTRWTFAKVNRLAPCNGVEYVIRKEQGVTERIADRLAVIAGLTPWLVWPEWGDDALETALERRRRLARESARRRYHEDEIVRAKKKAAAAAWRADNARTLRFHASRQPEARRVASATSYERNRERILAARRAKYQQDAIYREAKNAADRAAHARRKARIQGASDRAVRSTSQGRLAS